MLYERDLLLEVHTYKVFFKIILAIEFTWLGINSNNQYEFLEISFVHQQYVALCIKQKTKKKKVTYKTSENQNFPLFNAAINNVVMTS